jgi:hypothetical protein
LNVLTSGSITYLNNTGISSTTINTSNITSAYLNVLTSGSIRYLNSTGISSTQINVSTGILLDSNGITLINENLNITNGNLYASNYNNTNDTYYSIIPGYKGTSFGGANPTLTDLCVTYDISGSGLHYFFDNVEISSNLTVTGVINTSMVNLTSDYRIKKNVEELNEMYDVDDLKPVTYTNTLTNRRDIGFIAHEVQDKYPFLVTGEKDNESLQALNYIGLIPILTQEIKTLKNENKLLKTRLSAIEDDIKNNMKM